MIEYEICPMTTEAEMDEKGYIHWKSWHETYNGLMPDDYLKNITLEKCIKMAHKWPQNTYLLKANNKTIGFSCIGKTNDTKAANEVIAIYLLKEYHGQKLGYTLLNKTVSMFADNTKIGGIVNAAQYHKYSCNILDSRGVACKGIVFDSKTTGSDCTKGNCQGIE